MKSKLKHLSVHSIRFLYPKNYLVLALTCIETLINASSDDILDLIKVLPTIPEVRGHIINMVSRKSRQGRSISAYDKNTSITKVVSNVGIVIMIGTSNK